MKVEVTASEDCAGTIIADFRSRRARILRSERGGDAIMTEACVPLANMFGYVYVLRSMSQARASFTMAYDHYAVVPSPG